MTRNQQKQHRAFIARMLLAIVAIVLVILYIGLA